MEQNYTSTTPFFTRKNLAILLTLVISIILYAISKPLLFVPLLIFIGAFSMVIGRYISAAMFNAQIGYSLELVLMATVLSAVAYGTMAGMLVGGISMSLGYIWSKRFSIYSLLTIPTYILVGFLSSLFSSMNITTLGIIMVILYNLTVSAAIVLIFGARHFKCALFSAANIIFNIFLFTSIAPIILKVII